MSTSLFVWLQQNGIGDLHAHSNYSRCAPEVSVQDLALTSTKWGMPFVLTDHSTHLLMGKENAWFFHQEEMRGNTLKSFLAQEEERAVQRIDEYLKEIRAYQTSLMRIGVELDVTDEGMVLFPGGMIKEMAFFIGHLSFLRSAVDKKTEKEVIEEWKLKTEALMEAGVDLLAHPFRILARYKIDFDLAKLIDWLLQKAVQYETALEINSHHPFPEYDLLMVKEAVAAKAKLGLSTDTHRKEEMFEFSYHTNILDKCNIYEKDYEKVIFNGRGKNRLLPERCWQIK